MLKQCTPGGSCATKLFAVYVHYMIPTVNAKSRSYKVTTDIVRFFMINQCSQE